MIDMDKEFLLLKPQGRCNERYIRKNFPNEYTEVLRCKGKSFIEQLYNYLYNSPNHTCPVCGKETSFRNIKYGYSEYCCVECSYRGESRQEKRKKTCLEKYGVENVSQNKDIKVKKEKTIKENYGGFGFSSQIIRDKSNNTIKEKYGVENVSQNELIKIKKKDSLINHYGSIEEAQSIKANKTKQTVKEKYGVECIFQLPNNKIKSKQKYYEKFLKENPLVLSISTFPNIEYICKCNHSNCNRCKEKQFTISNIAYNNRKYSNSELCTILSPEDSNKYKNTSIEIFVKNLLDKYYIDYQTNVRNIIYPYELDIYIPSKNIAIECNGVYWHSDKNKEKNYHYNKYSKCKEKNIQLISIWEDQVINSPEKVESIILSKLGVYKERIYARQCIIKEVTSKESNIFLNKYHLQDTTNSSIRLGLYYNDELVSIMTFGKGRKCLNSSTKYELYRYCCKVGVQVIGGASKLFKYFLKEYKPESIESFSSNDISNGDLYKQLGFEYISNSIGYWYIDKSMNRYHRYKFTKYSLINEDYDKNKTEFEIMDERGFFRIYDSGQSKWIWNNI